MTDLLKIIECKGFTKDEAFASLLFEPNKPSVKGNNCTQAWKDAGAPFPGTIDFKNWAIEQLSSKTRNERGIGLHIVIDPAIPDIRKRPYSVINCVTDGTRSWTMKYQVREDDLVDVPVAEDGETSLEESSISIAKIGLVVGEFDTKADAINAAKELTTKNRRSYTIIPIKVPDIAPVAAYCVYTPSANCKKGTYIAFGYEY